MGLFFLGMYVRVKLFGHWIGIYLVFIGTIKNCSKIIVSIHTSINIAWEFQLLHILADTIVCHLNFSHWWVFSGILFCVLICTSLLNNYIEHLPICLGYFNILFNQMPVWSFCPWNSFFFVLYIIENSFLL